MQEKYFEKENGYEDDKKWIACLMAVGMMLSLTACGVSGDQVAVNKPQQKTRMRKSGSRFPCRQRICSAGHRTEVI